MSRSKKGSKAPGWDYWGKRPIDKIAGSTKRDGIQRERATLKRDLDKEPTSPEWDEREFIPPCDDEDCPVCR